MRTAVLRGACWGGFAALIGCGGGGPGAEVDTLVDVSADTTRPPDTSVDTTPDTASLDTADISPDVQGACGDDGDCVLDCAFGRCEAGRCVFSGADASARGCVVGVPATCVPIGAPDPLRPDCFFCNPAAALGAYSGEAFGEGFEIGAGRLSIEKLTPSPVSWTISTVRAAVGERSLYFGDPSRRTYDVGERAAARALTPALSLPEGGVPMRLTCQVFADTEETPGFDLLRVLVLAADGEAREVWSSDALGGTTHGEFVPLAIDLGTLRSGDRVVFEADTFDEVINRFEGFYLDAVRLTSTCCDEATPCDDGNACTIDRCENGRCVQNPTPGCCLTDPDCDDGDPCTAESCELEPGGAGICRSSALPGCCQRANDCDDADPCTEDRCHRDPAATHLAGLCQHAPLCCEDVRGCDDADPCTEAVCVAGQCRYSTGCCVDDAGCDDGLACTRDTCVAGTCRHDLGYDPGCCVPDVLTERFDAALVGWTLSPPTNNVGWRVLQSREARSGPALLYYGHPTLNFYESGGRNTGTAMSPSFRLPDGVELSLSLSVLIDVETQPARDLFRVELLLANGQTVVPLVDKVDLTRNTWQDTTVDLTFASGQVAALRFFFDSIDGTANTSRGVFIDDVRILSSCLQRSCGVSADCGSRTGCVVGACVEGACRFSASCP